MDDLSQELSSLRPKTPVEESWHNEQRRKQYDIIRVKNPVKIRINGVEHTLPQKDFFVEYDTNQYQKIEYGLTKDIPRHIATRFIQHKKDEIVNYIVQKMHDEAIELRRKQGLPEFRDKATENAETYETSSYPRTNDPKVMAEIIDQLWVGLVLESGRDMPPVNMNPRSGEVDLTPPETRILESLNKRRVPADTVPTAAPVVAPATPPVSAPYTPPVIPTNGAVSASPFADMSEKLSAQEVTNE